jgi:hypothetical protein
MLQKKAQPPTHTQSIRSSRARTRTHMNSVFFLFLQHFTFIIYNILIYI